MNRYNQTHKNLKKLLKKYLILSLKMLPNIPYNQACLNTPSLRLHDTITKTVCYSLHSTLQICKYWLLQLQILLKIKKRQKLLVQLGKWPYHFQQYNILNRQCYWHQWKRSKHGEFININLIDGLYNNKPPTIKIWVAHLYFNSQ